MSSLTVQQAAALAANAGFTGSGLVDIVAIMGRESGYDPSATNASSDALGLTQINWQTWPNIIPLMNSLGFPVQNNQDVQDYLRIPSVNLAVAYYASKGGTDFSDWNYPGQGPNSYLYNTDVNSAQSAVEQVTGQLYQPTASWTMGNSMASDLAPGAPQVSGYEDMADSTSNGVEDASLNALVNATPPPATNAAEQNATAAYNYLITVAKQNPGQNSPTYPLWQGQYTAAVSAFSAATSALSVEGPSAKWNDFINGAKQNLAVYSEQVTYGATAQTAQSSAAQNYNTAQSNANTRGTLAEQTFKDVLPYASPNGKTSFTAQDLGMPQNLFNILGIAPGTPIVKYPGLVYNNVGQVVTNAQNQMGVAGPMPIIPTLQSMGITANGANAGSAGNVTNPGFGAGSAGSATQNVPKVNPPAVQTNVLAPSAVPSPTAILVGQGGYSPPVATAANSPILAAAQGTHAPAGVPPWIFAMQPGNPIIGGH